MTSLAPKRLYSDAWVRVLGPRWQARLVRQLLATAASVSSSAHSSKGRGDLIPSISSGESQAKAKHKRLQNQAQLALAYPSLPLPRAG